MERRDKARLGLSKIDAGMTEDGVANEMIACAWVAVRGSLRWDGESVEGSKVEVGQIRPLTAPA